MVVADSKKKEFWLRYTFFQQQLALADCRDNL
jgi:hypothetical protein